MVCIAHIAPLKLGTNYAGFLKSGFVIWLAHLTPLTLGINYASLLQICIAHVAPLAPEAN
jgi:hypothetical protein